MRLLLGKTVSPSLHTAKLDEVSVHSMQPHRCLNLRRACELHSYHASQRARGKSSASCINPHTKSAEKIVIPVIVPTGEIAFQNNKHVRRSLIKTAGMPGMEHWVTTKPRKERQVPDCPLTIKVGLSRERVAHRLARAAWLRAVGCHLPSGKRNTPSARDASKPASCGRHSGRAGLRCVHGRVISSR